MVLYGTQVNPVVHANWGKLLPSLLCLVGGGGEVRHAEGLAGRQLNVPVFNWLRDRAREVTIGVMGFYPARDVALPR